MSKKYTNYNRYSQKQDEFEKPVYEKKVEKKDPEFSPEEKVEKSPEPVKAYPDRAKLVTNVYIREAPYGNKIPKDNFDRIDSAKLLSDFEGNAIAPKDTVIDIFDMAINEDGSVWYNTKYGYMMAKHKDGREFIK